MILPFAKEGWALDLETFEEGVLPLGFPQVDRHGNLYIMDKSLGALHRFTAKGDHFIIGKKGQGPNELGYAIRFCNFRKW